MKRHQHYKAHQITTAPQTPHLSALGHSQVPTAAPGETMLCSYRGSAQTLPSPVTEKTSWACTMHAGSNMPEAVRSGSCINIARAPQGTTSSPRGSHTEALLALTTHLLPAGQTRLQTLQHKAGPELHSRGPEKSGWVFLKEEKKKKD